MCCSREVKGSVSEERTLVLRLGNSEVIHLWRQLLFWQACAVGDEGQAHLPKRLSPSLSPLVTLYTEG